MTTSERGVSAVPLVSLREITEDNRTAVEALAVTFYQRYGFRLTGEVHEGEPILELDLYPARPARRACARVVRRL